MIKVHSSPKQWIYYLFCGTLFLMPMGTSPFTILGICLLITWVLSGEFFKNRKAYFKEEWFPPVVAMVGLAWLGILWSPEPFGLGLKYAKKTYYWLYAFAIAGAIAGTAFFKKPDKTLIKAFLGGLFINAIVGFLQAGHIIPRVSEWGATGYTGFYGGYNTLAILLILGMMTASFFFRISPKKKEKVFYVILMLIYFSHLIILEGRGGYLTLAILSPIIVYNIFYGKNFFGMTLSYALIIGIMFFSPIVQNRVNQTTEDLKHYYNSESDVKWGKKYSENIDRIYMWRWALDLIMKHPLTGVGTGGYRQAILDAGGEKGIDHPHNNFLYVAVSFGLPGLFAFCWLFWVLLKVSWRNRQSALGFFIMASSLVILVGGLTDTHILDAGGAFLLAITTGLLSALPKQDSSQ